MKQNRVERVLKNMREQGLSQMIVSDPASIYYLTGRMVDPGERLFALYLSAKGNHRILVNRLFSLPGDLGVEKIWYGDADDGVALLNGCIDHTAALGIDKNFPARFLLPLIRLGAAREYAEGSPCVDRVRARKDEEEQKRMRAASRLNDLGMEKFAERIHPGITELELASAMEGIYRNLGAEGYSFNPLVGFGKNAALGHHEPDTTVLREGDCVLLDVGCKKDGYCADMTRTFFFRSVTEEHRTVYELVRKANEAAEAAVRPGVRLCEIDRAARGVIEAAGYGENFTHRLGHFIGIEVHEFGDVSAGNPDTAQPGMIFSIEPGIYLEGDVGVRVEDLVLVTETGCEVLNSYPKDLQVLG